jgi:hypothetical protein
MRLGEIAALCQIGHDIPDRGWTQTKPVFPRNTSRANRLGAGNIVLDDHPQDVPVPFGQFGWRAAHRYLSR